MARVKSKDTGPEMIVRRLAHELGFRFRLHRRNLPGTPDIVFPARQAVIFVNGCFWHSHERCSQNRTPRTNTDYWRPKLKGNVRRDRLNYRKLRELGWRV